MERPWENEPDYKKFEYKGMICEIIRVKGVGHLCGYVHIPLLKQATGKMAQFQSFFVEHDVTEGNNGKDIYDEFDEIFDIMVHGGITFSDIKTTEQGKVFVIGFDCGHFMDLLPSTYELFNRSPISDPIFGTETYKTIEFVESECKLMVDQLLEEELNE